MCPTTRPVESTAALPTGHPAVIRPPRREAALDIPPPVVRLPSSAVVRLRSQTPQHVATLVTSTSTSSSAGLPPPATSLAPPLLVDQEYLVWGLDGGQVALWSLADAVGSHTTASSAHRSRSSTLSSTAVPVTSPTVVGETGATAPWIQFLVVESPQAVAADNKDDDTRPTGATAALVGFTAAGEVYHLEIRRRVSSAKPTTTTTTTTHTNNSVRIVVTSSWTTGRPGATCVCRIRKEDDRMRLVVGYENGYLEGWHCDSATAAGAHTGDNATRLLWRGHLAGYPRVTSVSDFLGDGHNGNDTTDPTVGHSHVLVMLQPPSGDDAQAPGPGTTTTAACLEVLDVTALEEGAAADRAAAEDIALEDYWVLPQAGRELVNVRHRTAAVWIPSHGSHVATAVRGGRMWVDLADGTVARLAGGRHTAGSGHWSWGLADTTRANSTTNSATDTTSQYLLRYPSVGRGCVTLSNDDDDHPVVYVACALRGGTVYLFPLPDTEGGRPTTNEVVCCAYPDDVAADQPLQHLQSFCAGNLRVSTPTEVADENVTTLPLLCFAWPGGIVEVYCAHLLAATTATSDPDSLTSLVENGTVEDLRRLLVSMTSTDALLLAEDDDGLWALARHEISAWKGPDQPLVAEDLTASSLVSFRALLVKLADPSAVDYA